MNELFLFYYLCWLLYIVVYFFAPVKRTRNLLLIVILLYICLSPLNITIGLFVISSSFMMLLISTIILFGLSIVRTYELFIIFISMLTYTSLLIWEKMAPVFFFMPATIMVASLIVFLVCILIKSFALRFIVIVSSLTLGQLMYELLLYIYLGNDVIGSYYYVNYLLVTILFLILIQTMARFIVFVITYSSYKYHY